MAKNIYVGNLVWDCTPDDLLALFEQYGQVTKTQVITDRETGRSRGFGFVALIFASVNIFGGFLVTQRMLAMYQKKKK